MSDEIIKVFTGNARSVSLLETILKDNGIASMVRNDQKSGVMVGFIGGTSSTVYLFVSEQDLEKAQPLIDEFNEV